MDPTGLVVEDADGPAPWLQRVLIGQAVHAMFSQYVENLGTGYSANNSYGNVFGNTRPDAYLDSITGRKVWELKPISNRAEGPLRSRAEAQVNGYIASANRIVNPVQNCGGWSKGNASDLRITDGQNLGYINVLGNVYQITMKLDTQSNSGLIFYDYTLVDSWQDRLSREIRDGLQNNPIYLLPLLLIPILI